MIHPTQSVRLPMVTYPSLRSPCVTYKTLCHAIGHQVLPTQPLPREAEDFPRGGNHFKHVPLPTYLAWLQPIYYNSRLVFIHVKTVKIFLVVKTLIKNIEHQLHLSVSTNQKIRLLPQKMHFRTWVSLKIALSKNTFQNMGKFKNCSLRKCISEHRWVF